MRSLAKQEMCNRRGLDKISRVLGLGYPGGPAIEKAARRRFSSFFSKALPDELDFGFGLKTAVSNMAHNSEQKGEKVDINDVAASFKSEGF